MTTRSIPQVMMSWLLYDHTFGLFGWIGVGIVFSAIVMRIGNTLRRYRIKLNAEKTANKSAEEQKSDLLTMNRSEELVTLPDDTKAALSNMSEPVHPTDEVTEEIG